MDATNFLCAPKYDQMPCSLRMTGAYCKHHSERGSVLHAPPLSGQPANQKDWDFQISDCLCLQQPDNLNVLLFVMVSHLDSWQWRAFRLSDRRAFIHCTLNRDALQKHILPLLPFTTLNILVGTWPPLTWSWLRSVPFWFVLVWVLFMLMCFQRQLTAAKQEADFPIAALLGTECLETILGENFFF